MSTSLAKARMSSLKDKHLGRENPKEKTTQVEKVVRRIRKVIKK